MIKAVLFDFDGTLVDSAPGIVATMEETFLALGIPIPPREIMVSVIGIPLRAALQQIGGLSDEMADRATETYRSLFPTCEAKLVKVFPCVVDTLNQLSQKHLRMSIVTSRDRRSFDLLASNRDLQPYFETAITGADGLAPKPAPDMVLEILRRMDVDPAEALVVGDTTFDIDMGNAAGCRTVAVTYGNHTRERLQTSRPSYIIDSFDHLIDLISAELSD
ncbi:MAG: HAD family hydrolase [Bacteroidales bacterium]|nr:HAD family hydrolase [Bacteroidales bacterium]